MYLAPVRRGAGLLTRVAEACVDRAAEQESSELVLEVEMVLPLGARAGR